MKTEIKYYCDARGNFPALEYINNPHNGRIKANILAAIHALKENGLDLLNTEKMKFIGYRDDGGTRIQGLYELRNERKKWRVAVYQDITINKFVILCGWPKNQQRQPQDILHAQNMQEEYLIRKGRGDVVTN